MHCMRTTGTPWNGPAVVHMVSAASQLQNSESGGFVCGGVVCLCSGQLGRRSACGHGAGIQPTLIMGSWVNDTHTIGALSGYCWQVAALAGHYLSPLIHFLLLGMP